MNCTELSCLLDEHDPDGLGRAERKAVEAHIADCEDCAGQWLASTGIAALRTETPPLPAGLRARVRELRELGDSEARTRRPLLIGSLLLLGAAATMFSTVSWPETRSAGR